MKIFNQAIGNIVKKYLGNDIDCRAPSSKINSILFFEENIFNLRGLPPDGILLTFLKSSGIDAI